MRRGPGGRGGSWVSERGAAAVEFALLVPIFLVMVFGIMDFGLLIYSKTVVNNAAREAARTASLGGTFDQSVDAAISAAGALIGAAPTVSPTCTLKDGTTTCPTWVTGTTGTPPPSGSTVKVTLNYNYVWMTPLVEFIPGLGSSEALRGFSQMVVE
jgi:Flp pilus assembly protein TadG